MNTGIPVNSSVEKVADLPFYTEGPVTDSRGNIYCTTLSGGSILKMDGEHGISEWACSPCPNGQIIMPSGDHLVCDVGLAAVRRFDPAGRIIGSEMEGYCAGVRVYLPNDLVADRRGNIYFTDSVRDEGKVCFLGAEGEQYVVAAGLDYPNGLVLSAGEECLYVAESYRNRIVRIDLAAPGIVKGDTKVFARLPEHNSGRQQDNLPDGLALDVHGNLWVAHYGMQAVQVLSPEGRLLSSVNTTIPLTSNVTFADEQTLVVTGGYGEPGPGALLKIHLSI